MTGEQLREELLAARKFTLGNERLRLNKMLAYIEQSERGVELSDQRVLEVLDQRPRLVFDWCESKGFGFNGGQQKKIAGIVGG